MVIVYHQNNKVVAVENNQELVVFQGENISAVLFDIASKYIDQFIIWCRIDLKSNLNFESLENIFHHHKIMASYATGVQNYIPNAIGYVEESPFIKVNKSVTYPTWLMSSDVGGIHASVLNTIGAKIKRDTDFNYFLNSVAKLGMLAGLFCYSEPRLLTNSAQDEKGIESINNCTLFRFVKQHYKKRWLLLLFLNLLLFEKRFPLVAFCYALFFKNRKKIKLDLDAIAVQSILKTVDKKTIDVIIPTIGRKKYLYDVLRDLAMQTHLPEKIIIVEQNPNPESLSELDYLQNEEWPFIIKHIFTHQAGVCNARNLALAEVSSEWVFLNDDDNRLEVDLIEKVFVKAIQYGAFAITTSYLQPKELQLFNIEHQSGIFGSGNSFVKTSCLQNISFDMALEFGYGEDTDFGMQLRYQGYDIIYFPDLKITHLKAPMGGFRNPVKKQWDSDVIQPKPSPTILYLKRKYFSNEQLNSYKLIYFLKSLKCETFLNWFSFYKLFQKRWQISEKWSMKLSHK